jgi:hypothetical protein
MTRRDRAALLLYPVIAVSLAFLDHRVRRFPQHVVTDYGPSVIAGTSGAPAKYRVLMPFALDWLASATGADPYHLFLAVELLAILGALIAFHFYLRTWYSAEASLGGTATMAAVLPLTFTNSWAHPDTFPDLILFTAGCLLIARRRDLLLYPLLIVGMLNRETIGFLAVLWAVVRLRDRGGASIPVAIARSTPYFAVCGAVYVLVRWIRGFEHYRMYMLPENISVLGTLPAGFDPYTRVAGYFSLLLLVPAFGLGVTALRARACPVFFSSALIVATLIAVVAWLFAAIIEVRVFVPVLPLIFPAAMAQFSEPIDRPLRTP